MKQILESCPVDEIYSALGGSEILLDELVEKLRDWLSFQPHLPQDVPSYLLEHLILHTKFSLEQAKHKLDMYYTVRRLVPEFFHDRDPKGPSIQLLRETTQWIPLPKLTPEKHRVTVYRKLNDDLDKYHLCDDMKYVFMTSDVRLAECNCIGEIYIYDLSNIRLGHMTRITPGIVKKAIVVVRIHVHSSGYESLQEFIPKSVLPKEYGGDEVSLAELSVLWHDKLYQWRDWFLEQENVMVDESRRPGPIVNGDDLFGFSGSFRKLEYD